MKILKEKFLYSATDDFRMINLPYENNDISMYIIIP